jgi:hypothetical protein
MHLSVDISKFKFHFGAPKYESDSALERAFMWYERYLNGKETIDGLIESEFASYQDKNEPLRTGLSAIGSARHTERGDAH